MPALENAVALSGPMEHTGLVGIVTHEKFQIQTLLSCTWGTTDPGAQVLVGSVSILWVLGGKDSRSPILRWSELKLGWLFFLCFFFLF